MDVSFKEKFLALWKKYFNGAELPITFYYTDEEGHAEAVKPGSVHRCVIGALAVIYGTGTEDLSSLLAGRMDWVQAYSFLLFTLIYTPCLSTVAVLKQESKSWGLAAVAVLWPLTLAWGASFAFYQGARLLGF